MAILLSPAAAISAEFEMAVFAPESAPGVLDQPIVRASFLITLAITDDGHCVVNITSIWVATIAVLVMHDTLAIARKALEV